MEFLYANPQVKKNIPASVISQERNPDPQEQNPGPQEQNPDSSDWQV